MMTKYKKFLEEQSGSTILKTDAIKCEHTSNEVNPSAATQVDHGHSHCAPTPSSKPQTHACKVSLLKKSRNAPGLNMSKT